MKVVLVHGQNHKESSNDIGRMIAEKIEGANEVTEFFLPRDFSHFCIGCYKCIDDERKCPYYEAKSKIMNALIAADILIFTTPTYCMHASGSMKAFLDATFIYWMNHKPRKEMFSKRAVIVSTSADSSTRKAIGDVKTALFNWGIPKIYTYGKTLHVMKWEDVQGKNRDKVLKDIADIAKKLSVKEKPKVGLRTKLVFRIMGMMQARDLGVSPTEKAYWESNGWLGKKRPWQ